MEQQPNLAASREVEEVKIMAKILDQYVTIPLFNDYQRGQVLRAMLESNTELSKAKEEEIRELCRVLEIAGADLKAMYDKCGYIGGNVHTLIQATLNKYNK